MPEIGDTCDSLTQTLTQLVVGGNLAAFGVGYAGRGSAAKTMAKISVTGLPENADILKAWLYFGSIGGEAPNITFDDQELVGELAGAASATCWPNQTGNFAYKLELGELFHGNGDYTLSGFPSSPSATIDGQGASIVVVYVDPTDERENLIALAAPSIGSLISTPIPNA